MARIELSSVTKAFGATKAVDGVTLTIQHGEFVAVLGASGCGKTTLLRLLAGLERVDAGEIAADGVVVSSPTRHAAPETRHVGVVFQSYALWPHMTVAENAGYPLRVTKRPAAEQASRTAEALAAVELTALAGRRPHQLSGGQQQRVALARCLTARPGLVLMDEPLANLDMHLRERMLAEFRAFHARAGATSLYITHDQAEAMSLADRIAVMDQGRLLQVAAPEELYRAPNALAVARFIGLSTLIPARVASGTVNGTCRIEALGTVLDGLTASDLRTGGGAVVVVRPEAVRVVEGGIPARVVSAVYQGGRFLAECETAEGTVLKTYLGARPRGGDDLRLAIAPSWVLPGDPDNQRSVAQGKTPAGKRLEIA